MTAKISPELVEQINAAKDEDPKQELPVIITLKPGTDPSNFKMESVKIQRIIKSISVISGKIAASEIETLSNLDQVELIEYDGTVYALDND